MPMQSDISHVYKYSLYILFSDLPNVAVVPTINNIAYMGGPVPSLTQDESNVRHCNADNLPQRYDISSDNQTLYTCPHLIPLKLDKVYEFILIHNSTTETVGHPIHILNNNIN